MSEEQISFPFMESAENLSYDRSYSYLLNFWYTSKLNKENSYIKRNGLHPHFQYSTVGNKNTFSIHNAEGATGSINTLFYTVFKIFLDGIFKGYKITKTRDTEEWRFTLPDDACALDDKSYGLMDYIKYRGHNIDPIKVDSGRYRYGVTSIGGFRVFLADPDELHGKKIIEALGQAESYAKEHIDESLISEVGSLFNRLITQNLISVTETKAKPVPVNKPRREVMPEPVPTVGPVSSLMPYYEMLRNMYPTTFDDRMKFRYLLNYAQASNPIEFRNLLDTDANYNAFRVLTNNFAA